MTARLQTLGGFEIVADAHGAESLRNRPTCSAVLLFLAANRTATRDSILALLWPERPDGAARHALSQTLYQLRRILGPEWIVVQGQELSLADRVLVDSEEFMRAVHERRFDDALRIYRGRYLDGWHLRGTVAFQHWVDRQVERFVDLHRTTCRFSIADRLDGNDSAGARAVAERWVELEPEGSEANRQLIELLVHDGQYESAVERFTAFERRLAASGEAVGPEILDILSTARARRGMQRDARKYPASRSPRVVVLPFGHAGPSSYAHLTYGLCDQTTVRLSRHPGLAVIARSSAFTVSMRTRSLTEIGADLGADHVLEATVHWQPGAPARATVSPQLVRVADGRQLWAAQLETDGEDVSGLPIRLADRTLALLGLDPLTGDKPDRRDPVANELYLRGLQHWYQRNPGGLEAAADLFIQAIEAQPGLAEAYAGLALVYAMMPSFLGHASAIWMPRARRAAQRSLDLNPDCAEGHLAMGVIAWNHDLDATRAGHHWNRTLELEPSNAQAILWLAYRATALGNVDEARRLLTDALALDPLSVSTNFDVGLVHWQLGDRPEALSQMRRVLRIDPDFVPAAFFLGTHFLAAGRISDARREWSRIRMFGPSWSTLLAKLDDPPLAVAALDRIAEISPRPVYWYAVVPLYVLLGAPERALFWLGAHLRNVRGEPGAYVTGGPSLFNAVRDPTLDPLRSTPEFRALLRGLGVDPAD